jgi:adenylosuccinate synthase
LGNTGDLLRASGMEFGTTTGRPRRCGWLDIVALKYCCQINGFSSLNLTKLDVLTGLKEIKLGTSYYTDDGNSVQSFPADLSLLEQVKVRTGPVNPVLPSCFSSVASYIYKIKAASGMALNLGLVLFLALLGT